MDGAFARWFEKGSTRALSFAVAGLTALVFAPSLFADFVGYDDPGYFYENAHVLEGLNLRTILWSFSASDMAQWHPLTWLSHAAVVSVFGRGSFGPHLVNVLLHAATAALVFSFLDRTTKDRARSLFVALLFALHPLRVESVAWVAERKGVLAGFFVALMLNFWASYVERPRASRYLLSLASFALAMMAKAAVAAVPAGLLLFDLWPFRRTDSWRRLVLEKLPFFALSAVGAALSFRAVRGAGAMASSQLTLPEQLASGIWTYGAYLRDTVWPSGLIPFYERTSHSALSVIVCALLLLAITALTFSVRRRTLAPLVGWLWFLGILFPVCGFFAIGSHEYADRYTYLPSIGLAIAVAWALPFERWRTATAAACLLLMPVLIALTVLQLGHWDDSEALFGWTVEVRPNDAVGLMGLSVVREKQERLPEAEELARRALNTRSWDPIAVGNLARILEEQGRFAEAIPVLRQKLLLTPNDGAARMELGLLLERTGKLPEALAQFSSAAALQPLSGEALFRKGLALAQLGRFGQAISAFDEALRREPGRPDVIEARDKAREDLSRSGSGE